MRRSYECKKRMWNILNIKKPSYLTINKEFYSIFNNTTSIADKYAYKTNSHN